MSVVYMDSGAALPTDPRVVETMLPYFTKEYGNPSSVHVMGRKAMQAVEEARNKIAKLVGGAPEEIVFTSGATESNNLAIKGLARKNRGKGRHIITTSIEHPSILETCKSLEREGYKVTYLPVDRNGMVNPETVEEAITKQTILISVMYANHEVGTIQPIKRISEIAEEHNIPLHVDGVPALSQTCLNVEKDGIDILTFSSNDIYGPKGVGALYIRKGLTLEPIQHGGGQERQLRSGSENVPGIVGFGKAAELIEREREKDITHLTKMRDKLIKTILAEIDGCALNGHPEKRLPNNVNIRFDYVEGESLVLNLEMFGIMANTGSACTSRKLEPSHVLRAMGLSPEASHGSLLLLLNKYNTESDVEAVLEHLPKVVGRLREISPLTPR